MAARFRPGNELAHGVVDGWREHAGACAGRMVKRTLHGQRPSERSRYDGQRYSHRHRCGICRRGGGRPVGVQTMQLLVDIRLPHERRLNRRLRTRQQHRLDVRRQRGHDIRQPRRGLEWRTADRRQLLDGRVQVRNLLQVAQQRRRLGPR